MRRFVSISVALALGIALGLCLLSIGAVAADDPLLISGQATPNQLTGPGTVNVSLNVQNISDIQTPITVTLVDPANNICASFGSGGTASLGPGASKAYSGTWPVTQAQLDAGKITYSARYSFQNETGQSYSATKPYPITVKLNNAKPELAVNRTILPNPAIKGQTVQISYIIKNTGTVDATDIIIADPGIISSEVTHPLLKVGEQVELSYTYVADDTSKTTNASITYSYKLGDKVQTSTNNVSAKVINITKPNLTIALSADKTSAAPGDKVKLTAVITNLSDLTYDKVKVTDLTAGDIDSGLSIAAGGQPMTITKEITMASAAMQFQFTLSGTDSTGTVVNFQSNPLSIPLSGGAPVPGEEPQLEVQLEADRPEIYEDRSDIIFQITVTNVGPSAVKNVSLRAGGKTFKTIPTLEPGETYTLLQQFRVSMPGSFQFQAVTTVDKTDYPFKSNIVPIRFKALSQPPTPTPVPTPPPPTEAPQGESDPVSTPAFSGNETREPLGIGSILLYALAVLLVLVVMGILLLFVLDKQRNRPAARQIAAGSGGHNAVIDSIQRTPHRDYARAPKRTPEKATRGSRRNAEPPQPRKAAPETSPQQTASYAPEDDDAFFRAEPLQASKATPLSAEAMREESHEPDMSAYRRPGPAKADTAPSGIAYFDEEPDELLVSAAEEADSVEEAAPDIAQGYLSRIRGGAPDMAGDDSEDAVTPLKPREPTIGTMSDEDAALLSGSTGQYRLSRNTASVIQKPKPVPEDPEAFTHRQRAQRSTIQPDMGRYYDDEDDTPRPTTRRRRA